MGFGTSGVPTDAPAINLFCHLRGWAHPSPDSGTPPRQPDRHLTFPKCIVVVIHMDATLLHIQPAAPQPIYRQIAEQIRRLVAGGQLAAGAPLPPVREVAAAPAINPMPVPKAHSPPEPQHGRAPGWERGGPDM